MTHFEWPIIIKSSDFLAILKNSKKNCKKYKILLLTRFLYENILTGQIDYLNFENRKTICSTQAIRTTRSIIVKLKNFIMLIITIIMLIIANKIS
jgi:hypothetical protein